jgi:hypothetical protein
MVRRALHPEPADEPTPLREIETSTAG